MVKIAVIGSSSMDLVVSSDKRPIAGETVLGKSFNTVPGGKGANQAVAAARLGAQVDMIGCVGTDVYGKEILDNFCKNGVNTDNVEPVTDEATGTAHIILAEGDNSIIVVKGANDRITPEYIRRAEETIANADIVMIQQEIPEETVECAAELCEKHDVPLLLNPAPARVIKEKVIEKCAYITPNEHECEVLFGGADVSYMLKKYPNKLIITEGKKGARYFNGVEEVTVPGIRVHAVDTTGAGDTFNGAFAVAVSEEKGIHEALRFANIAAALSVTKFGAQGGMPTREEVEKGADSDEKNRHA
ncbi:ribokinase [Heyndrickxia acidicola]|uniref:Ribokinase n=1 Tax=Heyndrickxia acidicola TaxID=209389 RepID=A0ABU6MPZ9_9BACI|nr:ribokinase [Heyndrickxia acidicola]MED1205708.1 ribokinase [Heyndrickxia acidicola]